MVFQVHLQSMANNIQPREIASDKLARKERVDKVSQQNWSTRDCHLYVMTDKQHMLTDLVGKASLQRAMHNLNILGAVDPGCCDFCSLFGLQIVICSLINKYLIK